MKKKAGPSSAVEPAVRGSGQRDPAWVEEVDITRTTKERMARYEALCADQEGREQRRQETVV